MKGFTRDWCWAVCVFLLIVAVSCSAPAASSRSFTQQELGGVWQADYSRYDLPDWSELHLMDDPPTIKLVEGIETITLEPDGTFTQRFESEAGLVSTTGAWEVEDGVVHLRGAELFVYGLRAARETVQGNALDCHGGEIALDPSELLLCVGRDRKAPGGVVLQHLPVGDPDAPEHVTFYRMEQQGQP